jgi:hypothetical protein
MRSRICELHSIGWSHSRIYKKHPEIPLSSIKTTIHRESIRNDNETRLHSGRPRKLTEAQRDHIYDLSQSNPHVKLKDLLAEVDFCVRMRLIQRLLHEMGCCKWRQLCRLELLPHYASQRLTWARHYEHYTSEIGPVLNRQTNARLKEVQGYSQPGLSSVHLSNSPWVMSVLDVQERVLSRCFRLALDRLFGQALFHLIGIQV